jgi:hypothetical protein
LNAELFFLKYHVGMYVAKWSMCPTNANPIDNDVYAEKDVILERHFLQIIGHSLFHKTSAENEFCLVEANNRFDVEHVIQS